jgi:hypothetical protein
MVGRYRTTANKRFPAASVRTTTASVYTMSPAITASWGCNAPSANIPTGRAIDADASLTRNLGRPDRSAAQCQPRPGSAAPAKAPILG